MLTIGIVANEASGDLLAGAVLRELKALSPGVRFLGVAGPHMLAAGCAGSRQSPGPGLSKSAGEGEVHR